MFLGMMVRIPFLHKALELLMTLLMIQEKKGAGRKKKMLKLKPIFHQQLVTRELLMTLTNGEMLDGRRILVLIRKKI